eukprot:SAG11_NODE_263_length_11526_cov_23.830314_8_plen_134_part_00
MHLRLGRSYNWGTDLAEDLEHEAERGGTPNSAYNGTTYGMLLDIFATLGAAELRRLTDKQLRAAHEQLQLQVTRFGEALGVRQVRMDGWMGGWVDAWWKCPVHVHRAETLRVIVPHATQATHGRPQWPYVCTS